MSGIGVKKLFAKLTTVHPKVCPWCGDAGCWTDGDDGSGLPVWTYLWAKYGRAALWWATRPFPSLRNRWFFEE